MYCWGCNTSFPKKEVKSFPEQGDFCHCCCEVRNSNGERIYFTEETLRVALVNAIKIKEGGAKGPEVEKLLRLYANLSSESWMRANNFFDFFESGKNSRSHFLINSKEVTLSLDEKALLVLSIPNAVRVNIQGAIIGYPWCWDFTIKKEELTSVSFSSGCYENMALGKPYHSGYWKREWDRLVWSSYFNPIAGNYQRS